MNIDSIINNLIKNRLVQGIENLNRYLTNINKIEYKSLMIDLISLSIITDEIGFTTPAIALLELKNNTYKPNIKEYIKAYNEAENIEEKRVYQSIITKLITVKEEPEENIEELINIAHSELLNNIETLKNRGIILLNPMEQKNISIINEATKSLENITSFTINDGRNTRVVLKYTEKSYERENKGEEYYKKGNFKASALEYRKLLNKNKITAHPFIKLGLCYLHLKETDLAIDYLTVAVYLMKKTPTRDYFIDTIAKLKNIKQDEDAKTFAYINENDFKNKKSKKANTIIELLNNGLSLEEINEILELTEEEKLIGIILKAEKSYQEGNYKLGDKYLNIVEKSPNKTSEVVELLTQTRKDKRFLKNRILTPVI